MMYMMHRTGLDLHQPMRTLRLASSWDLLFRLTTLKHQCMLAFLPFEIMGMVEHGYGYILAFLELLDVCMHLQEAGGKGCK